MSIDCSTAISRSSIYKVLAKAFDYPDADVFATLMSGELTDNLHYLLEACNFNGAIQSFEPALQLIDQGLNEMDESALEQVDLEVEYNRLFVAIKSEILCPPCETEVMRMNPMQKLNSLADLMGFYRAWGLALSDSRHELPDHICTEFEFLHFLTHKEAAAAQRGEKDHVDLTRTSQQKFFNDHLLNWIGGFCQLVTEQTAFTLYKGLAQFTHAYVRCDQAMLCGERH